MLSVSEMLGRGRNLFGPANSVGPVKLQRGVWIPTGSLEQVKLITTGIVSGNVMGAYFQVFTRKSLQ